MLSDHFRFAYRILRSFHAAGAEVHVLGAKGSRGLRFSRYCASFRERVAGYVGDLAPLVREANAVIDAVGVDLVVSGEHSLTGGLIAMAPSLRAPCFPMPTLEQFALLNNKWRFTQFCGSIGLKSPRSLLVEDRAGLRRAVESGAVSIPLVAKPIDSDGARGVEIVRARADLTKLDRLDYAPILVQDFIDGADVAASVYSDHGEVKAFIAHRRSRATYYTVQSDEIRAGVERIAATTKANGVLNFDMRVTPKGDVYWLECNPRLFFWVHMSLLAGVPFVEFGLPDWPISGARSAPAGTDVRFLPATMVDLAVPWRLTRYDFAYLRFVFADPVPWARECIGLERA